MATQAESISWGSLELWVKGRNLCEHIEDGVILKSVNWYLLPFLEWIAQQWDPLLHEQKLPIKHGDAQNTAWESFHRHFIPPMGYSDEQSAVWDKKWYAWMLRHSLLTARTGGLFPDIFIRRYRDDIEISWGEIRHAGAPQGFRFCVPEGVSRLESTAVSQPLFDGLIKSVQYLKERCPDSKRVATLFQYVQNIPKDDQTERLAWLAGLDAEIDKALVRWKSMMARISSLSANAEELLYAIRGYPDKLVVAGSCDAAIMFGSLAPTIDEEDVMAIARKMLDAASNEGDTETLRMLTTPVDLLSDTAPAWDQGYHLAMELHEKISIPQGACCIDVEGVLRHMGIHCEEIFLNDCEIRALSLAGPRHKPTILLNMNNDTNQYESGRRFSFAHELCHLLHDRSYGVELAMATGPWAPRDLEKRANAFAAMFIMPTDLVRTLFGEVTNDRPNIQDVLDMAATMKTSIIGLIDHLHNLGLIDDAKRERLRETAATPSR